jgi:putative transposase
VQRWLKTRQYVSIRYSERLADNRIVASVGSKGDSYTPLARSRRRRVRHLTYVDWFNHRRRHGEITDDASYTTPAEFEAGDYRQTTTVADPATGVWFAPTPVTAQGTPAVDQINKVGTFAAHKWGPSHGHAQRDLFIVPPAVVVTPDATAVRR